MIDKADSWYQNWSKGKEILRWEEFELCRRFGEDEMADVVEEFMRVRQDGIVRDYQDRFEELRLRMERILPNLDEKYYLSVFM